MKNFGSLKMKMLKTLTDSYQKNEKKEIKKIITTIKEDKNFKELFLLYEDVENKYFEDESIAKLYVEELSKSIKGKSDNINSTYKKLSKLFENIDVEDNELYNSLDQLIESDNLFNIDKKVIAKKKLVDFLLTKKETSIVENKVFTDNENLLHAVLTNNFNTLYNSTLNEEQKTELKNILNLSNEELEKRMKDLKESVDEKITSILSNTLDSESIQKLQNVKKEISDMSISKYNLYRLKELKNGLD